MNRSLRNPTRSRFHLVATGMAVLLLSAGCSQSTQQSTQQGPWLPPSEGTSSLLFTDGAAPPQPIVRGSDEFDSTAATKNWDVDRTFTGTINSQGGQIRQRYRATRQVGDYTETFTATRGQSGTTYQRSFRESGKNRSTRGY